MLEVTSKEEIVPWIVQEKEEAAFFFSEIKKKRRRLERSITEYHFLQIGIKCVTARFTPDYMHVIERFFFLYFVAISIGYLGVLIFL